MTNNKIFKYFIIYIDLLIVGFTIIIIAILKIATNFQYFCLTNY